MVMKSGWPMLILILGDRHIFTLTQNKAERRGDLLRIQDLSSPPQYIDSNITLFLFFLMVSCLTFWNQPTSPELAIVSTKAAKEKDVLLCMFNKPPNDVGFMWYSGRREKPQLTYCIYCSRLKRVCATSTPYSGLEKINSD